MKEDPKYVFRYAKKFKRTSENIGPLLNGDGKLTNDMQEISHILSNHYCNTFSTPRCLTRCTRGDARSFFSTYKMYLYAQNEISYEYIQILF